MYFSKKLKIIFIIIVLISSGIKQSNALENKILFKIDNEIITTIDIYEEIKFLKVFNPEINNLDETKLYEISKSSILRDKIKKIEIMNFMDELKVNDKFILNLINNKYPKIKVESLENFEIYLKNNNLNSENIREKFTIELIWNDLVYQKFSKKIIINKEKIKNEILQNAKKDKQREVLLSEIIFNVNKKNEFTDKYEKILLDIEKIGFKKTALIHSNSDTASNGGLIGWIKEDNLNQNIKEIISKLQPGQFTKPIRTTSGYMLIKIEEDREYLSNLNLDDKINEVIKFKMNNQLNQFSNMYFNKLKKNLTIYGL